MIDSSAVALKPCLAAFDEARIRFIKYLDASGCSPNTVRAYGHDLTHLRSFLVEQALDWFELTPTRAVDLLIHLHEKQSHRRGSAQYPSLAAVDGKSVVARLSGATINRVLAAVSSF
jgi:integrase/recombinase XerD